ncbi:hypothetical protein N8666_00635 [bacterium]|nr:hypothetical protein [bacterium]|tara:strand:- start:1387 stop:1665 length:279 start_codon:yes stop_codon:yes gene_type:complete
MADLHKAIRAIHNLVVTINGDTQETIVAKDASENIVTINWTEVNAWTDPDQYKLNRKKEYPSIEELVVALYDTEDKLAIENKRKAIKEKYPK